MSKRHKTDVPGVYYTNGDDGTRTYIATWKEERPLNIADPSPRRLRKVEKSASTFEEACRLKLEGEQAARRRPPSQSPSKRLGERMMAAKWLQYWVRR